MGKNKVRKAEFIYGAEVELDDVLELGERLKKARDAIRSNSNIVCDVELYGDNPHYWFNVSLKEDSYPPHIDTASNLYISIAGLPEKVYSNYGFDGIEKSLPSGTRFFPKGVLGRVFGASVIKSK